MYRFLIATLCVGSLALGSCASHGPSTPAPQIPQRIISVVPSATEMLFAFGLADRIIAVGDYDELPPGSEDKPRIGGLLNPNIEKIIEYQPDLVITYGSQDILRDRMKELGIRIYPFTHGSISQTLDYMMALGRTVGAEDKAREIENRIRMTGAEISAAFPDPVRRSHFWLPHKENDHVEQDHSGSCVRVRRQRRRSGVRRSQNVRVRHDAVRQLGHLDRPLLRLGHIGCDKRCNMG